MEGEIQARHRRDSAYQRTDEHDSHEPSGEQVRGGRGRDEHRHDQDDSGGLDAYDDDEGEEGEEHVFDQASS